MEIQKALVVDDSKVAHLKLSKMLRERDIDVDWAGSGEDSIKNLRDNHFDIVFMDVMMPGMDGFEATHAINNDVTINAPPIIMCSANTTEEDIINAQKSGALGFLSKPYTPDQLDEVLDSIRQGSKEMIIPGATASVAAASMARSGVAEPARQASPPPAAQQEPLHEPLDFATSPAYGEPPLSPATATAAGASLSRAEVEAIARQVAEELIGQVVRQSGGGGSEVSPEAVREAAHQAVAEREHQLKEELQQVAAETARNVVRQGLSQGLKAMSQHLGIEGMRQEIKNIESQVAERAEGAVLSVLGGDEIVKTLAPRLENALRPNLESRMNSVARDVGVLAAKQHAEQAAKEAAAELIEENRPSSLGMILGALGAVLGAVAIALQFVL